MINGFIDAIEEKHFKVNDKEILSECLTLVDNNGKIEAADGKFDDCVTATAIGFQVCIANTTSIYDNIDRRILV